MTYLVPSCVNAPSAVVMTKSPETSCAFTELSVAAVAETCEELPLSVCGLVPGSVLLIMPLHPASAKVSAAQSANARILSKIVFILFPPIGVILFKR